MSLRLLWQARDVQYLLNLIGRLPQNSHYAHAIATDEEYAKAAAEHPGTGDVSEAPAPSMAAWSPEVDMLARLVDSVNALRIATIAASLPKGKTAPTFEPVRRPERAVTKVARQRRRAAHDRLVALVQPAPGRPTMDVGGDDPTAQISRVVTRKGTAPPQ